MNIIVILAGKSSRTVPIKNKNLVRIAGKPFFVWNIQEILETEKNPVFVFVVAPKTEYVVQEILDEYSIKGDIVAQENQDEGMAGAVRVGLEKCKKSEPVIICNGIDYTQKNAYQMIKKTLEKSDGALLVKKMDTYFPGGYIKTDHTGKIEAIIEKPGIGNEPSDLVTIVLHGFSEARILAESLEGALKKLDSDYEQAVSDLCRDKIISPVVYEDVWLTIKYPWHFLVANDYFLYQQKTCISKLAKISDKATLEGDGIVIEDDVVIKNNATIVGPAYIGKKTFIGQNTLIRQSSLEQNSQIGFGSEIVRSLFAKNVSTHHAYVGDSVLEKNVNFGAFSCTTNFRLDKKSVFVQVKEEKIDSCKKKLGAFVGEGSSIGSGAKIMPGRIIYEKSFVAPNKVYFKSEN